MNQYTVGNTALQSSMDMPKTLPPEGFLLSQEGLTGFQQTEAQWKVNPDKPGTLRVFSGTLVQTAEDVVCSACGAAMHVRGLRASVML